jgi:signal transduction histidine kinase
VNVSWARLAQADRLVVDAVVALVVVAAAEVTSALANGVSTTDRVVTAFAGVGYAAPIALRRVWPAAALVASAAVVLVSMLLGGQILAEDNAYVIPPLLLSYTAGWAASNRRGWGSLLGSLGLLWAWAVIPRPGSSMTGAAQTAEATFYVTVLLVPTWLAGRLLRRRSLRSAAFRALADTTADELTKARSGAAAVERARIGSELQDLVARSVTEMVSRTSDARRLLPDDRDRARESILKVEATGREALADLRQLLGILRKDGDPRALSPQPGLAQVDSLISSLGASGFSCRRTIEGLPVDLSPGVDLVAYRVIEAGLEAVARSDRGGLLRVNYRPYEIEIEIEVDSDHAVTIAPGTFSAIADRVALYDGSLSTTADEGHFVLRAWLPLAAAVLA